MGPDGASSICLQWSIASSPCQVQFLTTNVVLKPHSGHALTLSASFEAGVPSVFYSSTLVTPESALLGSTSECVLLNGDVRLMAGLPTYFVVSASTFRGPLTSGLDLFTVGISTSAVVKYSPRVVEFSV